MDLISRKEVRRLIWRNNDKYGYSDRFHEFTEEVLNNLPSAFEGMTNIEIIKAIFPIAEIHTFKDKDGNVTEYVIGFDNDNGMVCSAKWADSPYKGVSE